MIPEINFIIITKFMLEFTYWKGCAAYRPI